MISCGIYGEPSGTGTDFLRVLWFPLPIYIPPPALHSLIILTLTLQSLGTTSVVKQPIISN
jgi:hypothetical protein